MAWHLAITKLEDNVDVAYPIEWEKACDLIDEVRALEEAYRNQRVINVVFNSVNYVFANSINFDPRHISGPMDSFVQYYLEVVRPNFTSMQFTETYPSQSGSLS